MGRCPVRRLRAAAFPPKGKVVVLGLITTKRGELEDRELLKRRIDEASRYVDLDQLCLSPQCGFSSTVEGNLLTREQKDEKLRFFFASRRRHTRWTGDWSSDVCSSD